MCKTTCTIVCGLMVLLSVYGAASASVPTSGTGKNLVRKLMQFDMPQFQQMDMQGFNGNRGSDRDGQRGGRDHDNHDNHGNNNWGGQQSQQPSQQQAPCPQGQGQNQDSSQPQPTPSQPDSAPEQQHDAGSQGSNPPADQSSSQPDQSSSQPDQSSSPPASAAPSDQNAQKPTGSDILAIHNQYRAKHHAPAMTWDDGVATSAQSWADHLASTNSFEHSGGSNGENLAMGYSDWAAAADGWYSEVKDYNFASGSFSGGTGHFTQMVWIGSTKLGCGTASSGRGTVYVCQYSPPGNMMGAFQENVKAP